MYVSGSKLYEMCTYIHILIVPNIFIPPFPFFYFTLFFKNWCTEVLFFTIDVNIQYFL